MRRFSICLVLCLLGTSFSLAARREDIASSEKGQAGPANCSGTSPYANFRFALPTEQSADQQYSASVMVLGWGQYECPDGVTLTEQASTEATVLAINVTPPTGHKFVLQSARLNEVVANPGFIYCGPGGITPCEVLGTVTPGSTQVAEQPVYDYAVAVSGADGTANVWSFGNVATTDLSPAFGAEYIPGGPYLFQPVTDPTGILITAAVEVGGCAPGQSTPPGDPPLPFQSCMGVDPNTNLLTNYSNSLTSSTTYSIVLMDTTNGSTVTIGTPITLNATSGAAHDVSNNPVSISSGAVINQIFDLSGNYPLENTSGGQIFDPNNPSQPSDPPPCAGSACPDSVTLLPYHSVWFEFTSANGSNAVPVTVNTAYSHYDTVLSVFTGQPGSLTPLPGGFNDDNPAATAAQNQDSSLVTFTASPSTSYYILVTEYPPMPEAVSPGGFNYTSPLNTDPTLYLTLTTPQLTPSPTTLANFGAEMIGSTTAAQQLTLTAQYSGANGITSINASISGDFKITSPACASSLNDGTTCTLTIVFTPTGAGIRTGTLTITSNAENSPLTIALSGTGVAPPLAITTTTLPVAAIGSSYSGTLQAAGGIPPYNWSVVSGSLPTNLSLDATTGVITGAATQAGTSSFTVQVSDSESPAAITTAQLTLSVEQPGALQFVPVAPCRIADTRNPTGPFGGPAIAAKETRSFTIPQSACGIPSTAAAYALNVTVVPEGPLNFLTVWPAGQAQPTVSLLNSTNGQIKANAAIIPAGVSGAISVYPYAETPTHVVIDISGYFIPATASGLAFYPLTPCRIADTRNADGPFGGPSLSGGQSRAFPVQAGDCKVPAGAQAYSLNITAIPMGPLNYLTLWPTGQAQPTVSTLNADTGTVTANAAIVPAGNGGQVSVFVTNDSNIVVDVNGYFAPPAPGGTSLYTTTPCRVLDTRAYPASPFPGTYTVGVVSSACTLSASASAYVLNATVVPVQTLGYLSLWPGGESQPLVSTLNALDGSITSNMAIVPTTNGSIDAYATNATQLILDVFSFFAP